MSREFDSPWKELLDPFLEETLELFFPEIYQAIDWTKGYESLDGELQQILREGELGPSTADKLFRVTLRDGTDVVILIPIEVQSQSDANFPLRMYVYHYRIRDRYNQPVVSLAILCGLDPQTNSTSLPNY